jgi:hypothetical protein
MTETKCGGLLGYGGYKGKKGNTSRKKHKGEIEEG